MASLDRDRGSDHYRPHYARDDGPPLPPSDMFQFRGAAGGRNRRPRDGRSDFTFRAKAKISERPLLRDRGGLQEEQVISNTNAGEERFRNLEELSDSDEAEMEESEDDEDDEDAQRSKKRVRVEAEPFEQKPMWSNPDVYTSLPAPSETNGKKIDFVKLIRKARNASTKSSDLIVNDEDFISFDDTADDNSSAPTNAPTGPRVQDSDITLGKRKRGDTSGAKLIERRGRRYYQDGMILDEWRSRDGIHPTPWLQLHQDVLAGLALHKEILDFYNWVKPRDYEFEVRAGVIDRINAVLNRIAPGELKAFGSFAAGLYLPTGDMDLVYLPRGYHSRRGVMTGISQNNFRKYGDHIRRSGLAQNGSVTMIGRAKVPIIKFIEKTSGLKVDLSFSNDTGVVAIDTFRKWKEQHPAMPIIVSIIKQFLMIRGLNDVSVGGLGGFSIICLVTSILQHLPLSGNPPNLGQVLVEFFNVYGNLFDRDTVAIRLDPPGYIDKTSYMPFLTMRDKASRLTIIDPNRADNNISGGTHEIQTIFSCFSRAHEVLQNRLVDYKQYDTSSGHGFSFLEDLVGGDFSAYQAQRDILHNLHFGHLGPAPAVVPPPPPPVTKEPLPPPPPSDPVPRKKNGTQTARGTTGSTAANIDAPSSTKTNVRVPSRSEKRAERLKLLRPELASSIGKTISLEDAVKRGGYGDYNEMDKDLTRREREREARS